MKPPRRQPGSGGYRPGGRRDNLRRDPAGRREPAGGRRDLRPRPQPEAVRRPGAMPPKPLRRPLPPEVLRRIDADPLFQVMTSDQQQWVDPFTGTPVPASLGRAQAAREYLLASGVWKDKEPLPRSALEMIRWRLELMRLLPIDPRLRIFGRDGKGWLNPYSGELAEDVAREDGKITARTVMGMARSLSSCPQVQTGRLLDNQTLMARVQALGLSQAARPGSSNSSSSAVMRGVGVPDALSDDMVRAKNVQEHMLADLPEIEGYELAVHYSAHSGVSGDFYEVLKLADGKVLMLLGDVSGHGMQAALVVATALKTLRFLARQTNDLVTLLSHFNDEIRSDLLPGQFITMFAGILDPEHYRLTCVRAGHHPGLIANLDSGVLMRKVGNQGIGIGLVPGRAFAQSLHPDVLDLQPGDVLLQYTDGLTEAANEESEEYGDARLYGSFISRLELPLKDMIKGIADDVVKHAQGNVGDDLTIFTLAVYPEVEESAEGEAEDGEAAAEGGDETTTQE